MNEFRKQADGSIVNETQLRHSVNASFPRVIGEEDAAFVGYNIVSPGTQPEPASVYEEVTRDGEEEIDGKWYAKYKTTTLDKTTVDNRQGDVKRKVRNELLTESDWTQLGDSTVADKWKTYRQELRDITTSTGFPHNITWPTKPS